MNGRLARAGALALTAVLAALALAAAASGSAGDGPPDERLRIVGLRVIGGEQAWHPERNFRVFWDPPQGETGPAVLGAFYRVENAAGEVVVPTVHLSGPRTAISPLPVPPVPGEYRASIWLEGSAGNGPPAGATLRFDDTRPAPVQPRAQATWFRAGAEVSIRIDRPQAPLPLAGIGGYAVAVDRGRGGPPCARSDFCEADEIDLPGGAGDDWIALGQLDPGSSFVHVVSVSGSGMHSEPAGSLELRVDGSPPRVALGELPDGWSDGPLQVRAEAADTQSGMAAGGDSRALTAIAVDGLPVALAAGASTTATVHGEGIHLITPSARDAVGNATWEHDTDPALSGRVRIDETAPSVAFAATTDPTAPERLEAMVSDALSGPGGRGWIEVRRAGSGQAFAVLPTAVSAGRMVAIWDSDSYARGRYEFRAVGFDAAGNRAASSHRRGGAPMELDSPLKQPTGIELGFGGRRLTAQHCERHRGRVRCRRHQIARLDRRPAHSQVRFGRDVPVAGRLATPAGRPLAGVGVAVVEEFGPGGGDAPLTTPVQTGSDGSFYARLSPGPSRRVRVTFAGDELRSRSASRTLRLDVGAAVSLHASATTATVGGAPVVFSGAVAPVRPGLPVELQFRARAPRHPGWPYAAGSSLPLTVAGR